MKYLDKFVKYIKETKELDFDLVENEYLVPIRHLGVKTNTYKTLVTKGQFSGYNQILIVLDYESFNVVDDSCIDKRIWELLDEVLMFKNVIDSYGGNNISIRFTSTQISISIYEKVEENDEYFIKKLFNELNTPYHRKLHFRNENDSINVYIDGTKTIWNNFIRDNEIDISKFNLEFTKLDDSNRHLYWRADLIIKITVKN
jgi:hypothetical protein